MPYDPLAINAGELRNPVTFLQATATPGLSGMATTWVPFLTTRAKLMPVRGIDKIRAGQDVSTIQITVVLRWSPGITAAMRLQTPNGVYVIQAIENVLERNRKIVLTCLAIGKNE